MQNKSHSKPARSRLITAAIATALLVGLSDILLFDVPLGVNLFCSVLAVAFAIVLLAAQRGRLHRGPLIIAAAAIFALPLIETPSPLGLVLGALGLALAALVAAGLMPGRIERMPATMLRFLVPAPITLLRDAVLLKNIAQAHSWQKTMVGLLAWVVPLGLGLIFVMLFASANPLIDAVITSLRVERAFDLVNPARLLFWLIMAAGIWALLRPRLLRRQKLRQGTPDFPRRETAWFGHAAVLRSLVIFNALFAVETVLDLAFLWGGMTLPNGMSHAEYAHRGAYPLIVTALLAAAFVLIAMRRSGPGERSPLIRTLVYAFIVQNILLCLSAMLRLELYVEVYSLTELRLAAGIWTGLVAAGLVFILFRIWRKKSNAWLVACNLLALVIVLYGSALTDFSALIARFNVDHSLEVSGEGLPLDFEYLGELGPSATPALDYFIDALEPDTAVRGAAYALRTRLQYEFKWPGKDWRSWSWRSQRLADYLAEAPVATMPLTLHNNAPPPR